MATLTGNTVASTYTSLIKVADNSTLNASTTELLSDGAGNNLPLKASQTTIEFTGNVDFNTATVQNLSTSDLTNDSGFITIVDVNTATASLSASLAADIPHFTGDLVNNSDFVNSVYVLNQTASLSASLAVAIADASPWEESGTDIYYTAGQVGIGTDVPDHQLFVSGADQCLAVFKSSTTGGGITFMDSGTTDDFQVGIGAFDDNLCFLAGGTQIMRILDNGNIGMGTLTPDEALQVVGNVSASGFIGDLTGTADTASYVAGANVDGTVAQASLAVSALNATNADNVDIDNVSADTVYGFVFRDGDGSSYQQLYADSQADTPGWNPSTNTITAPIISASTAFSGDLDGNAATATTASYAVTASYALNAAGGAGGPAPVTKLTAPGTITIDDDTYANKFVYVNSGGTTEVEFESYLTYTYTAGDEFYFMNDGGDIDLVSLGPTLNTPAGKTAASRGGYSVIGIKVLEAPGGAEPTLVVFGDLA